MIDMTEFKVNADESGKSTIKVPLALIGPIWGIVACVGGLWFTMYNTQRDQQEAIKLISRDVVTLKSSVSNVERTVGIFSDTTYTIADAARDQSSVKSELADHEARIRALENKRRR